MCFSAVNKQIPEVSETRGCARFHQQEARVAADVGGCRCRTLAAFDAATPTRPEMDGNQTSTWFQNI